MNMERGSDAEEEGGRISLLRLERYLNGELGEEEAAEVRRTLQSSPELRAHLQRHQDMRSALPLEKILVARPLSHRNADSPGRSFRGFTSRFAPRPAAMAALASLLLAAGIWTVWIQRGQHPGFQPKGASETEIRILTQGKEFKPGSEIKTGNRDTLLILYKAGHPVHAEAWYSEDGGEPLPLSARMEWEASTSWKRAPRHILLVGNWKRQTLWILHSDRPMSPRDVKAALAGTDGGPAQLESFQFVRTE